MPEQEFGEAWEIAVSTAEPLAFEVQDAGYKPRDVVPVEARSIVVLRRQY